jgi:hypothetical protein
MIGWYVKRSRMKQRADAIDSQALVVQAKLHAIAGMRHYTAEEWKHVAAARKALVDLRIMLSPMRDARLPWEDN